MSLVAPPGPHVIGEAGDEEIESPAESAAATYLAEIKFAAWELATMSSRPGAEPTLS